jgi:hypothetical protein
LPTGQLADLTQPVGTSLVNLLGGKAGINLSLLRKQ